MKKWFLLFILLLLPTPKATTMQVAKGLAHAAESMIIQVTNMFLIILEQDEYQVIIKQEKLLPHYEEMLSLIVGCPFQNIEPKTALTLADALFKGANIYRRKATEQSLKQALVYHKKALEIRKKHLDENALDIAHSLLRLGATYNELKGEGNNTHAIEYYQQAIVIYKHHQKDGERFLASALHQLGNAKRDLCKNNTAAAIELLDRALAIFDTLADNESRQERAKVLYNQGINHCKLGGEDNFRKAITYLEGATSEFDHYGDNFRLSISLSCLGTAYRQLGPEHIPQAIGYLENALRMQKELFKGEHVEITITYYRLGLAYRDCDMKDTARAFFGDALAMQKKLLREDHLYIMKTKLAIEKLNGKA